MDRHSLRFLLNINTSINLIKNTQEILVCTPFEYIVTAFHKQYSILVLFPENI